MIENIEVMVIWDELIYQELFTEQELQLITNINGYSLETLNSAIYARYGYRDYKQMVEAFREEE